MLQGVKAYFHSLVVGILVMRWVIDACLPAGVTQEKLDEGLSPRHCALSLVGEPIMYPEINTLVDELHRRRISTFLVTNAQFPDKIKLLKPVTQVCVLYTFSFLHNIKYQACTHDTRLLIWFPRCMQLYVSVDAATKESLKAIDRPLFGDFWERFIVGFLTPSPLSGSGSWARLHRN